MYTFCCAKGTCKGLPCCRETSKIKIIETRNRPFAVYGVYARCVTGNVLQNNSKGHWEVKIIYLAAEGT